MATALKKQLTQRLTQMGLPWLFACGALILATVGISWISQSHAESKGGSATRTPQVKSTIGHPSFMSSHTSPIAVQANHVFVVNTPSDTVDVIDTASRKIICKIDVGIDPVSIAVRPDGRESRLADGS